MITPNNTRLLLSSRVSLLFTLLSKHTYLHSVMGSIGSCLWLINLALALCGNVITQTHAHTSTSTCTVKRVPVEWNRGKWPQFISASRKIRFGSSKHTSHVNKRHLGFGWEKKNEIAIWDHMPCCLSKGHKLSFLGKHLYWNCILYQTSSCKLREGY